MKSHVGPGLWRRLWTALGGALKRGLLGKSGYDYMKQFTGRYTYWDNAIAAQRGWPQKQAPRPETEPEYEPVHGWTKRQLDDYLGRNPDYKPTYEAELLKHCYGLTPEVNGSCKTRKTAPIPRRDE